MVNVGEINELLKQGLSVTAVSKKLGFSKTTFLRDIKSQGYSLKINDDGIKFYELNVLQKVSTVGIKESSPQNSFDVETKKRSEYSLDEKIDVIRNSLDSIVDNFITVSVYISGINSSKEYEQKGFKSIFEFTQTYFDISKSQTSKFIRISNEFIIGSHLDSKYEGYSFSQLAEILYLPEVVRGEVTPDMTVKEIREKKKKIKEEVSQDQFEGQTFVDAAYEHVDDPSQFLVNNNLKEEKKEIDYKKEFEILQDVLSKRSVRFIDKDREILSLKNEIETYKLKEENKKLLNVKQIEPILKTNILEFLNKRISEMKEIAKNNKDDVLAIQIQSKKDAFEELMDIVLKDFDVL